MIYKICLCDFVSTKDDFDTYIFFSVECICNFLCHRKRTLIYGTETFQLLREGSSGTQENSQGDGVHFR